MLTNAKALIAKSWKNENADLSLGRHEIDETLLVRVRGHVEKHNDQMIAPTVSIPLVSVLAFFWEKAGIERDAAMSMLREAIHEALANGENENAAVQKRIEDVNAAIQAVKTDLIAKLPKMSRAGRLETKNLAIDVVALSPEEEPQGVEAA